MTVDASAAGRVAPLVERAPALDAEGAALARRTSRRTTTAAMIANGIGVIDVFLLLFLVLPSPPAPPGEPELARNLVAGVAFVVLSFVVGKLWGDRLVRPMVAWLVEGRVPSEREREGTLRLPLVCASIDASFWAVAAVLFGLLNAHVSVDWAWHVGSTILMGGITVTAVSYLISERLSRGVIARALAFGPPSRPFGPSVKGRLTLAWLMATGVPLIGLVIVGCVGLFDETADMDKVARSVIVLAFGAFLIGLVATLLVAKSVAEPLRSMRSALRRIEEGDLDATVRVDDGSEVGLVQSGFNQMVDGLREREQIRELFGRHVGEDVARVALDGGTRLGGEVREIAALFVDLVGSTRLAAERPPQEVVALLNRFFAIVVDVVGSHGGWVNKFEGDAALVVFGAPIADDACATSALCAARDLDARLRSELPEFGVGIGVSAGPALAGNVGAEHRLEYTVIGDPVNEAARLCDLAKRREARVVASEAIVERARKGEAARWLGDGEVVLRGRTTPTKLAVPASWAADPAAL
ncbi:MAG TPA: adenylate/guanylate cyclase domain-containing protein [Solirubrobacteraceae bacterium]|jgi:adenylate cyclase